MPIDEQTSILVEIARNGGAGIAPQKLPDLMDLVAAGYVEADDDLYKLTTAGQNYLIERGVGAQRVLIFESLILLGLGRPMQGRQRGFNNCRELR